MEYSTTNTIEGNEDFISLVNNGIAKNITVFTSNITNLTRLLDDIEKKINKSNIPSSEFTFDDTTTECAFYETTPNRLALSPTEFTSSFGCNIKPGEQGDKGLQGNQGIDGEMGTKGPLGPQGETGHAVVYQSFQYK